MLGLFGFGKRRRVHHRSKHLKGGHVRKPPAALLKMCRKMKIKTTIKRGSRRVYKSVALLKKLLRHKKKMLLRKKHHLLKKHHKTGHRHHRKTTHHKTGHRRRRYRREEEESEMEFGAVRFGMNGGPSNEFGAVRFGMNGGGSEFGKRRVKVVRRSMASRKKAMAAFRKFYKRYCKVSPVRRSHGRRRMHFGDGGNPPLRHSMGYSACGMGEGGVVESNGLFPTACSSSVNQALKAAEESAVLSNYGFTGGSVPDSLKPNAMSYLANTTGAMPPPVASGKTLQLLSGLTGLGGSAFGLRHRGRGTGKTSHKVRGGKLMWCMPAPKRRKVRRS